MNFKHNWETKHRKDRGGYVYVCERETVGTGSLGCGDDVTEVYNQSRP